MADGVQIEGMVFEASGVAAAPASTRDAAPTGRDRAVAPDLQEDDLALDRSLRPKRLGDYLGQTKVKESLAILIEAAEQRKECPDHILFSGPPGLGKTTLATVVAQNFSGGTQPFLFETGTGGAAGDSVAIVDGEGGVVASLTAAKQFFMVCASRL